MVFRLFWILVVVAALGGCIWQLVVLIMKYLSYGVNTDTEVGERGAEKGQVTATILGEGLPRRHHLQFESLEVVRDGCRRPRHEQLGELR